MLRSIENAGCFLKTSRPTYEGLDINSDTYYFHE